MFCNTLLNFTVYILVHVKHFGKIVVRCTSSLILKNGVLQDSSEDKLVE